LDVQTLLGALERQASLRGAAPAIRAVGSAPLSHEGLLELVRETYAALARAGVARDTRVGVVMSNAPEMAAVTLATAAAAVAVPLNPAYTEAELHALLTRLGVSMVLADRGPLAAIQVTRALGLRLVDVRPCGAPAGAFELSIPAGLGGPAPTQRAREAMPDDLAIVLHTSGSTAEPKIVPLSHRNLLASAGNVARSLGLGPEDVCLSTMPLFHVGAIVDLLLAPLGVGGSVVIARDMGAREFFAVLAGERPTWYQGVPTMLSGILRHADAHGLQTSRTELRFIRSVSAPLPETLLHRLESRFGIPVIEIYGMTETAGVITSNPMPPGERRPGSVGLPVGLEVVVDDGAGNDAPPGVRGEILVRGDSVMRGYEIEPGGVEALPGGWLRTGDEGYVDVDGYLYLTGRIKDIINRGGEKIAPCEIDEITLAHPDVLEAAAFALPHDTLGEDVALAVVPRPGRSVDVEELKAFLGRRVARFKVPHQVHLCASLPRAPGGKLQRGKLPAWCSAARATESLASDERSLSHRQRQLVEVWESVLGVSPIDVDSDFVDLGGDSLRAVELALAVSEHLGVQVPAAAIYDNPTILALDGALDSFDAAVPGGPPLDHEREMLREVRDLVATWEGARPEPDSLLVGWNTRGTMEPLFWGAQGLGELRLVAEQLGPDQPVWGMRSLYETRSKSPENLAALAGHYRAEIERMRPEGAIRLGGYCAGGGLAFEVARQLVEGGREVATLSLFEHVQTDRYPGRLAYFFAVESGWHPFSDRETEWLASCGGHVSLHPSRSSHLDILRDREVLGRLGDELSEASLGTNPGTGGAAKATASGAFPRVLVSRERRSWSVELTNVGDAAWPPGTTVYSRWHRPGSRRVFFDAASTIEREVARSERSGVPLQIRAPLAPGPWILSVQVVSGGNWNGAEPVKPLERMVMVLPGAAVWSYVRERLPGRSTVSLAIRRLTGRTA
jgi:acyl-CoA synthetase (AMP-forming)/AMP-acid ligase II/acyl carrier protein